MRSLLHRHTMLALLSVSYPDCIVIFHLFFFNDPATTEIYTLSLHDALPISAVKLPRTQPFSSPRRLPQPEIRKEFELRSEEHTSELQSHSDLVCRLLLEKKKKYP